MFSIFLFVHYQTCERGILNAYWQKWWVGLWHEVVNFGGQEVKGGITLKSVMKIALGETSQELSGEF